MLSYSRWKFEFESGGKPNLLAVSGSLKTLWIDSTALLSTHKTQWEVGSVPRYQVHYCFSSNAAPLRSRQARARLRIPRIACLTSSSSIDYLGEGLDGFFQLNQRCGGGGGGLLLSCHCYAPEPSPGGTGPDPATGAWSGGWCLPPNLLFSQFLALIVVCTVAPSCWNQQEPHIPRKWGAFVPRAVLLFAVFTWAFTCKFNARTSNDFRWLPERKEAGENRPTSGFELELSAWITLRQIIPDE